MKQYPLISVVIPTFNSASTLPKVLDSVRKQTYPKSKIETLIIDGGSSDNTLEIAKRYSTKVIPNPRRDLIYGKHLGYLRSKGKYMISLDSDEVLKNRDSFKNRIAAFQRNRSVTTLMSSGLETPKDYAQINHYINDFGDPFSYFNYGLSHNPNFYSKQLTSIGDVIYEDNSCVVLDFHKSRKLPIIEPTGASGMIDLAYTKKRFPEIEKNSSNTLLIFYLHNQDGKFLAITKNDSVLHYSSGSIKTYFKKLISRVKNNVFKTEMGMAGFSGRTIHNSRGRWKQYLFIPYSFSIVLPFFDTLKFLITRKKRIYIIHPVVCIYISLLILYFMTLKVLGVKPQMKAYGS